MCLNSSRATPVRITNWEFYGSSDNDWKTRMELYQWLFDGIGTAVLGLVVGGLGGGFVGYRIGKQSIRQSEKARDNAVQTQIGTIKKR